MDPYKPLRSLPFAPPIIIPSPDHIKAIPIPDLPANKRVVNLDLERKIVSESMQKCPSIPSICPEDTPYDPLTKYSFESIDKQVLFSNLYSTFCGRIDELSIVKAVFLFDEKGEEVIRKYLNALVQLIDMGFKEDEASCALQMFDGDVQKSVDHIMSTG